MAILVRIQLREEEEAMSETCPKCGAELVSSGDGWPSFEYVDDTEGMVAVEVPEVVIQNFHRILGGA